MQTGVGSGPVLSLESLTDGRLQVGTYAEKLAPAPFQGLRIPVFQYQPAFHGFRS